jgi:catechol 2,3-dioxygenase
MPIPPETRLGPVTLTVRDLDRVRRFYEQVIGLRVLGDSDDRRAAELGVEDGQPLVALTADPAATLRPPGTTGLFHLAVLVPDRIELARALRRVSETGWRLAGASDHLVSEALYMSDPEGNGIEIYRDRPSAEWGRDGDDIRMATLPLDLRGLLGELEGQPANLPTGALPAGTRIGHVHLNVADLDEAEAFYRGLLGFGVTVRGYPGALFLSAGGYHHHVGLNTWAGEGAPPPPPDAAGLRAFEVALPTRSDLDAIVGRLTDSGSDISSSDGKVVIRDPSGNGVALSVGE